jgi:hypothetical protein
MGAETSISIAELNGVQFTCKACGTVMERPLASIRLAPLECDVCGALLEDRDNSLADLAKALGKIRKMQQADDVEIHFVAGEPEENQLLRALADFEYLRGDDESALFNA